MLDAEKRGLTKFGIRQHHEIVNVGDDLGVSYNTTDDTNTEKLNGICCLQISYDGFDVDDFEGDIEEVKSGNYQDGSVILVGGTSLDYGNDVNEVNEVIIGNAEVLWVE